MDTWQYPTQMAANAFITICARLHCLRATFGAMILLVVGKRVGTAGDNVTVLANLCRFISFLLCPLSFRFVEPSYAHACSLTQVRIGRFQS